MFQEMSILRCHGETRSDVAIQLNHQPREAELLMVTQVSSEVAVARRRSNLSSWVAAPSFLGLAMTIMGVEFWAKPPLHRAIPGRAVSSRKRV
jgi:hypothetical protein